VQKLCELCYNISDVATDREKYNREINLINRDWHSKDIFSVLSMELM